MLTPSKILELVNDINKKHTKSVQGSYPAQKKIVNYIYRKIKQLQQDETHDDITKVKEMTNLLEGFIRYLDATNKVLKLDVEKILTYIYYPENEELTIQNKDNLLIGRKGETVRLWHDAYFMNNRTLILNRLIECKNVLYNKANATEYMKTDNARMPEQMQKKYEEMLANPMTSHKKERPRV